MSNPNVVKNISSPDLAEIFEAKGIYLSSEERWADLQRMWNSSDNAFFLEQIVQKLGPDYGFPDFSEVVKEAIQPFNAEFRAIELSVKPQLDTIDKTLKKEWDILWAEFQERKKELAAKAKIARLSVTDPLKGEYQAAERRYLSRLKSMVIVVDET